LVGGISLRVLRRVAPLMWPEGEPGLKLRVIAAFALIVAAKLVNVTLPLVYKSVIDSLTTRPMPCWSCPSC